MRDFERWAYLSSIDGLWKEHLYELDQIKEGVGLQAYGQKDPLLIYKQQAFESFQNLLAQINKTALRLLYRTDIRLNDEPQQPMQNMQVRQASAQNMAFAEGARSADAQRPSQPQAPQAGKTQPVVRDMPKVGRNDPCPCGSGKKYKHCHGAV